MVEASAPGMGEPLLPGEVLDAEDPDDVEHWVTVYTELLAGTGQLRGSVEGDDPRIEREFERLRLRLAWWLRRRQEILNSASH